MPRLHRPYISEELFDAVEVIEREGGIERERERFLGEDMHAQLRDELPGLLGGFERSDSVPRGDGCSHASDAPARTLLHVCRLLSERHGHRSASMKIQLRLRHPLCEVTRSSHWVDLDELMNVR